MIFHPLDQNSAEWYKARLGVATASCFDKIVTPSKFEFSKSAYGYIDQLIAERITGESEENFTSYWMERGTQYEGEARSSYELLTGFEMDAGGFFTNDEMTIGASPDCRVFQNGRLVGSAEIKCPKGSTHINNLYRSLIDQSYYSQVQGQMYVMGTEFVDFISYHPDMPFFHYRVNRDDEWVKCFESALIKFFDRMADVEKCLNEKYQFEVPLRPIIEIYNNEMRKQNFENDELPSVLMAG